MTWRKRPLRLNHGGINNELHKTSTPPSGARIVPWCLNGSGFASRCLQKLVASKESITSDGFGSSIWSIKRTGSVHLLPVFGLTAKPSKIEIEQNTIENGFIK